MTDGRHTNTRERILDAALDLMSERGYGAVSVRDLADAVGIKGASLYKHFAGKREAFDALIARETAHIERILHAAGANATLDDDARAYVLLDGTQLEALVWESYAPFFMDERVRKLRRMLEVSRYADVRCGALYEDLFIGRPIALQRRIFDRLVSDGVFAPCDTFLAAQQFHGPMLMVMGAEADADQARRFCAQHLEAFNEAHGRKA